MNQNLEALAKDNMVRISPSKISLVTFNLCILTKTGAETWFRFLTKA